jgi:hypothetical protein
MRLKRLFVISANATSATSRTPDEVASGPAYGAAISRRYAWRDSSSLAPANIWRGSAISSSWPLGKASSRTLCVVRMAKLYQALRLARRPKASQFRPSDKSPSNKPRPRSKMQFRNDVLGVHQGATIRCAPPVLPLRRHNLEGGQLFPSPRISPAPSHGRGRGIRDTARRRRPGPWN